MKSVQHAHFEADNPEGFDSEELAIMARQVPKGTKFTFEKVHEGPTHTWQANATWDAQGVPNPIYTSHQPGVRGSTNPTYEGPGGVGSQER